VSDTVLRITALSRADHEDICRALATVGEQHDGEHSCGIYVRTAHPENVVEVLRGLSFVTGCWANHHNLLSRIGARA